MWRPPAQLVVFAMKAMRPKLETEKISKLQAEKQEHTENGNFRQRICFLSSIYILTLLPLSLAGKYHRYSTVIRLAADWQFPADHSCTPDTGNSRQSRIVATCHSYNGKNSVKKFLDPDPGNFQNLTVTFLSQVASFVKFSRRSCQ